jgi:transposase InsO family protein
MNISKQAVHQHFERQALEQARIFALLDAVERERSIHKRCGLEKLYYLIRPDWIGRDRFCSLLMELGYGVGRRKNYRRTTYPVSSRYQNLIEGMVVSRPWQVVQTDITYFESVSAGRFFYLTFLVDVYSKVIYGYQASDSLSAEANIAALRMLLKVYKGKKEGLVHHSDRGSQYVDRKYVGLLQQHNIQISMCREAYQNAYAERVNGIIKNEYLNDMNIKDLKALRRALRQVVRHYNQRRPHRNLAYRSPKQFEAEYQKMREEDKPKIMLYFQGKENLPQASLRKVPTPYPFCVLYN